MKRLTGAITLFAGLMGSTSAFAQDTFWVQVEANTTLTEAQNATRLYDSELDDVVGFRLGASGWYATALGPYSETEAAAVLVDLIRSGAVPGDAYVSDGAAFGQQFWPVGANSRTEADETPAVTETQAEAPVIVAEPEPEPEPIVPEETPQEARQSEAQLDREAREALQIALQFEGFYTSGIDGAFGPGTRGAMAAWQEAKGYEATGILTTRQRDELIGDYNAVFDSLALASVMDQDAGIELIMPTAMADFDRYEAPFAHYEGDQGVRVVLISQSGGQSTLYGLYDILQSLEVVPTQGERSRGENSFEITGSNRDIVSYTYAEVVDGAVKGYMLIWPTGDEKRRNIALSAMKDGFTSTGPTVLDDNAGLDEAMQSVDLVSGLEIRRADRARTGFYVAGDGTVLTTTEAVAGCSQITLDESYPASVVATDEALGAAIVKPEQALAPLAVASLSSGEPRIKSDLAVAGYSFGGRLSSATLTFGQLADIKGLDGEDNVYRLDLEAQDGDAGGPIVDNAGMVLGMLKSDSDGSRQFPDEVSFATKAPALAAFLEANGVVTEPVTPASSLSPHALAVKAADMSVLVSCWE
ncbi:putative peptidoglycan binding protein [Maritimibacter alkaliphilus HTCC2654]|uniref:Peptidoglycan binding domain protein n=2 Tax=Maritimibacter TaxID=404235 RepID=A3VAA7_9RHOB|nr:peptidoglycan binding domain protein [Maritimibacter alkaliphilus HTCC2654]TYP80924.1 putative peptidoglycan binding protein [Maritimibacter alkaliphilus HTCC2654]